jgi:hypothetical protein
LQATTVLLNYVTMYFSQCCGPHHLYASPAPAPGRQNFAAPVPNYFLLLTLHCKKIPKGIRFDAAPTPAPTRAIMAYGAGTATLIFPVAKSYARKMLI